MICLIILSVVVFESWAQITFSRGWKAGKRSLTTNSCEESVRNIYRILNVLLKVNFFFVAQSIRKLFKLIIFQFVE
jgi:hypothetical protein